MLLSGCALGFRGPALNVADNAARLTGDVVSNRTESGTYWFRYGKTTSYGLETPHQPVDFTANIRQGAADLIESLDHNTTYHYSLCAEDQDPAVDALCSGDSSFTTDGDFVRGPLLVLLGGGAIITLSFDDVSSGYNGENPRGNLTGPGTLTVAVTCLNVSGNQRFTVGVVQDGPIYWLIFVDLSPGVNTYAAQVVGAPATTCPADPPPGLGTSPAAPGTGFAIHDG
jgi:hypothetical protein